MIARFFRSLLHAFKTPWVLALGLVLLLILLVWLLGPLVAVAGYVPLEGVIARLVATVLLIFCWGLFVALSASRRRRKELDDPEAPGPTSGRKSTRCSCATSCATSGSA